MTLPLQHIRMSNGVQDHAAWGADAVGLFLDQLGLRCRVVGEVFPADSVELPIQECQAGFCLQTAGNGVASVGGKVVCELGEGDLALFLREDRRAPITVSVSPSRPLPNANLQQLFHSDGAKAANVLCGIIEFRADARVLTAGSLPSVIRLQRRANGDRLIDGLLAMAWSEAGSQQGGRTAVLNQLLSTICLETLREQVSAFDLEGCAESLGWLRALRDAEVGMILSKMLLHPEQDWTVESLAELVPMARSTFARKFRQLSGGSPMSVLLEIRMRNACELLRSSRPLKDVARHAGYRSLSAFTTAFRRWSGQTPQSYRFAAPEKAGARFPESGESLDQA